MSEYEEDCGPDEGPLQVAFHDGCVLVYGPASDAVILTPEEAERSADKLRDAAQRARRGQSGVVDGRHRQLPH